MRDFVTFLWTMTAVMVVLKITNMIWWSWWLVLSPVLALYAAQVALWLLGVLVLGIVVICKHCTRQRKDN